MNSFERIDDTLHIQAESNPDCLHNSSELDGFLHAVSCAPDLIRPSVWINEIWGGAALAPKWPNMASAENFVSDVITIYNDMMAVLNHNTCKPVFLQVKVGSSPLLIAEYWCLGFQRGLNLVGPTADTLADHTDLIAPIMLFSSEELEPKRQHLSLDDRSKYQSLLPLCVLEIRKLLCASNTAHLTQQNAYVEPFVYPITKTGISEKCICGSGRKYQTCCGANY